jgi:hypothetical protein
MGVPFLNPSASTLSPHAGTLPGIRGWRERESPRIQKLGKLSMAREMQNSHVEVLSPR